MNLEKLKNSKCPHCKQYGIKAFGKIGYRTNRTIVCGCCGKQYKVNWALSFVGKILIAVLLGLCANWVKPIGVPFWVWCILLITAYGVFEYFVPMEEVEDK